MSRNPILWRADKWTRKLHRWGAVAAAVPLLVIIGSGLLLQLKKQVAWVQPPEQRVRGAGPPSIAFERILATAKAAPEAGVRSWDDIDRLDVRVDRGIVKVLCRSHWELQIDTTSGALLQTAYRRSDLIESIHDGSFFHSAAKLWVFLPAGVVLLGLWFTGVFLWVRPVWARRAGRRRRGA